MSNREWSPIRMNIFGFRVQQLLWSDWAGSAYTFARDAKGNRLWFWTRKAAQAHADKLNEENHHE